MKQHEGEKNLMFKGMDDKTNRLRKDIEKLKNLKNEGKTEIELLFEKFKKTVEESKQSKNYSMVLLP